MLDHEVREFVSALTKTAQEWGQTQQLRERIRGVVFPFVEAHREPTYDTSVVKRIATQMGWTPPREAQPVVEAMQSYLRQCRAGGMPKDVSDQIERAVNQANHLGYFAAPTPDRAPENYRKAWQEGYDQGFKIASGFRTERAQESAGMRLSDDQIREIWMRETGTFEHAFGWDIVGFARAVLSATKEPQP